MKNKRLLLTCGAMLLVSASVASAGGYLNNGWDTCVGDGGTSLRTSACASNSNTGAFANVAVQSVVLDSPMPAYRAFTGWIHITTFGGTLPAWWSCPGKLSPFSASGRISPCTNDAYAMSGGGGSATTPVHLGWNGANTIEEIYAVFNSVGAETDLEAGLEYFVGSITISNAKSTGADACPGCDVPACIDFAQAQLDYLVNGNAATEFLTQGSGQQSIWWQSTVANCSAAINPTGSRTSTWGAIKSLYR